MLTLIQFWDSYLLEPIFITKTNNKKHILKKDLKGTQFNFH